MAVALLDRDGERAADEARSIGIDHGVPTVGVAMDVTDRASVDAAADASARALGPVDLVISNVGVQLFASIERATDEEWAWVLDTNVVGSARIARAFLPMLRRASRGRLAFTSSSSVLDPASRMSMYQSSKFAVWGLAETLAVELAADGVTVSTIFPSGMLSRHLETSEAAQPGHIRRPIAGEDDFSAMHESNPTMSQFLATPEEAASGVIQAVLEGRRYIVTHGRFEDAVRARAGALLAASEAAP
jgi:NAD(P)-dependent dehydrogenase (short-subunit alcohol dehydrogenase family)